MRVAFVIAGALLALAPLAADGIGIGARAGLGVGELGVVGVGVLLAGAGAAPEGSTARRWLERALAVLLSTGVSLFLAELALRALSPAPAPHFEPRGMLCSDAELEYAMTPNWTGRFDGAFGSGQVRLNSLGHRDAEPKLAPTEATQILLLGDSFAFGNWLDQSETIDAEIERLSHGEIDAYNAGVPGYNPPNVLAALQRASWFRGSHVLYLFFQNDLHVGEQNLTGQTVVDGWLVQRYTPDGVLRTEKELRSLLARAWEPPKPSLATVALETLRLVNLRAPLERARESELRLTRNPIGVFSDEGVAQVVHTTEAMREVADSRGQRFAVVIIPAEEETRAQRYLRFTRAYVGGLHGVGIETVELLGRLDGDDYIRSDGHFSARGAASAGRAIVAALEAERSHASP